MSKRNYTHVQGLLPEIKAMKESGKTHREIAEHYGFRDKFEAKRLLKRDEKSRHRVFQSSEAVSRPRHWPNTNKTSS